MGNETNERPNSVLTSEQRKFLRMSESEREEAYSRQSRTYHRKQIRKRARAAFQDFSLLYEALGPSERKDIFQIETEPFPTERSLSPEIEAGIIDTLGFLYLTLEGEIGEEALYRQQIGLPSFESALQTAVNSAEHARRPDHGGPGPFVSTELTVEVYEDVDVAAAAEKLARGDVDKLSEAELRGLVQTAYNNTNDVALEPLIDAKREELGMDPDELRAAVQEWFEDTYVRDENDEGS